MHFQTFSVVVGSKACNAHCPFCISKQTGLIPAGEVNWRNFHIACNLAEKAGTTTVLLTGKGEPTLYPDQVTDTLVNLKKHNFPLVEMQTNGISIANGKINDFTLRAWYELGLTTIAISVVHWNSSKNAEVYTPNGNHYDLVALVDKLHKIGFSVRICVMLLKGYIDTPAKVDEMITACKAWGVEQLTFRNIVAIDHPENKGVSEWTRAHALSLMDVENINQHVHDNGTLLHKLMHNTLIYDVRGQNVCVATCLTQDPDQNDFRQLIFFPDGSLYWDWQYKGARIL